jgi:hypothetical protein
MSYDLDVRADARYSKALPVAEMAAMVAALPGVTRLTPTSFAFDRLDAGMHVHVHLVNETGEDDSTHDEPDSVNSVALSVPYPLLGKTGPVALEMAFQIAEKCGWSVYDPQGECVLTRETAGAGLELQRSSGTAARSALERAARADASLGEVFTQEMWNHTIVSVVACVVLAAAGTAWILLALERPRDDFNRYMPWGVAVGSVVLMWVKGLAQAVARRRRR